MTNIRIFIWKLSVFGGEIINVFEKACFHNAKARVKEIISNKWQAQVETKTV